MNAPGTVDLNRSIPPITTAHVFGKSRLRIKMRVRDEPRRIAVSGEGSMSIRPLLVEPIAATDRHMARLEPSMPATLRRRGRASRICW